MHTPHATKLIAAINDQRRTSDPESDLPDWKGMCRSMHSLTADIRKAHDLVLRGFWNGAEAAVHSAIDEHLNVAFHWSGSFNLVGEDPFLECFFWSHKIMVTLPEELSVASRNKIPRVRRDLRRAYDELLALAAVIDARTERLEALGPPPVGAAAKKWEWR